MVNKILLQELKTIIKEEYSEDLSDDQIHLVASGMVRYFDLLSKLFHQTNQDQKNEIIRYDN